MIELTKRSAEGNSELLMVNLQLRAKVFLHKVAKDQHALRISKSSVSQMPEDNLFN